MPFIILLAVPEALVPAAVALLIVFGVILLAAFVSWLVPDISIPGLGSLRSKFVALSQSVVSRMEDAINAAIQPFTIAVGLLMAVIKYPLQATLHAMDSVYNNLAIMTETWIPSIYNYLTAGIISAYNKALAFATAIGAAAARDLLAAVAGLQTWVHGIYAYLVAGIESAYAKAVAYAAAIQAWAGREILDARAAAAAALAAATSALSADITTAYTRATAYAAAVAEHFAHVAVATVDAEAAAVTATIWPGVMTDVDGLVDALADGFTDVKDAVGQVARAAPADLVGALEGVAALSVPLLRLAKDCTVPQCKNLGALSNLFGDLFSAATDAALVALFAEMAADPAAGAAAVRDVLGPVADGAVGAGKTLVGAA